jgi:ABC-2 type transport system ATP-binding protein
MGKIVALDTPDNLKKVVGGDVVELKCGKCSTEKLRKLPFVKRVDTKDGSLLLKVSDASKHLNEILHTAVDVQSVHVHLPTLDDVFLHYTGKEIRDGTPEGGWAQRVMQVRSRGK